ncbi:OmpA family protein [Lentimicrobium sp. S6]|uniref:OmpA family protein n=1 Tax=Lentimicrobium sp. S6 TaxID=2735872 RepID=UPI00155401DA|nr:OmpA family protein [Lentimicrobium sp. S6]NPD47723.1 OmpA family protein [Lentimicrobium sp. S6]
MKRIFLLCLFALMNSFIFAQSQTKIQTDTLNLFFETDHYKNTDSHLKKLKKLEKLEITSIKINAFTDSIASNTYNQKLSNKRAYYSYFTLLKMDFPIDLFSEVKGFGESIKQTSSLASSRKTAIIYQYQIQKEIIEIKEVAKTKETTKKEIIPKKIDEQIITGEVGDKIIAKNINFQPGNHHVLSQSIPELEQLYLALTNHSNIKIEIRGHICCQYDGSDGYDALTGDYHLSVNRAFAVYSYLISNGINKNRLSYRGFGSTQKIYEFEKNDREKIANRRVEIVIIEN